MRRHFNPGYLRNILFGAEDSLVSTVGVLFGVATAYVSKKEILLTGLIIISVEALSMGVGSFLSETSTNEAYAKTAKRDKPLADGILMFLSYFGSGFVVLAPYMFFYGDVAKYTSLGLGMLALFILGYAPAKNIKSAIRMIVLGTSAVLVGFVVAYVFKTALG